MMSPQSSQGGYEGYQASRPSFYIGQHDSQRTDGLTDSQYNRVLDFGV